MRRPPRTIPALVLVILYAMIVMSPLAPLALLSPVLAHALTGTCAGDCSICGCSTERSAGHTCCCWQKKTQETHEDEQDEQDCCKKNQAGKNHINAFISSRPCSSGKTAALAGLTHGDVFPYRFSTNNPVVFESIMITRDPDCRIDWPGEPPDPPPKLSRQT
ncbi:MAG TPA: hypothetical protein HPP97_03990 [Desulfuromonadales bacterium]|nr:hypothetical protein [Desulfuromonadales bacterium]